MDDQQKKAANEAANKSAKTVAKKAAKKAANGSAGSSNKPRAIGLGATLNDDTTRALLYEGASKNQLCILFDMHMRDVTERVASVEPCGMRQGYPIYRVKDVAPHLVKGHIDVEQAIKRMSPKDLPAALSREYWLAQAARLRYEEEVGDLWRTEKVIEVVGDAFKNLKMSILLMQDQVERTTALTSQQREIIQQLADSALNDLADALITKLSKEGGAKDAEVEDEKEV